MPQWFQNVQNCPDLFEGPDMVSQILKYIIVFIAWPLRGIFPRNMPRGLPVLCCTFDDINKRRVSYKTHPKSTGMFWNSPWIQTSKQAINWNTESIPFFPLSRPLNQREENPKQRQFNFLPDNVCCRQSVWLTDWRKVPGLNSPSDV